MNQQTHTWRKNPFKVDNVYVAMNSFSSISDVQFEAGERYIFRSDGYSRYDSTTLFTFQKLNSDDSLTLCISDEESDDVLYSRFSEYNAQKSTPTITNESYVKSVRSEIVSIINSMLSGDKCFLYGSYKIASLRHEAAVSEDDADFLTFVAIASETDELPIGPSRAYWSTEALAKHQPKIESARQWAKATGLEACHSIISRFSQK